MENMKIREEQNIIRPDMINILQQVRKGQSLQTNDETESTQSDGIDFVDDQDMGSSKGRIKRRWTDDEIVSQCFIFFLGGLETTSTLMAFLAYELALNPDIQQKLYEELRSMEQSLNGKRINYESILKLKYLD